MGSNWWQALTAFNLFRLLENETLEMFSMDQRSKSKQHKLGGMRVCEADELREYFINPKIENEALG